MLDQRNRMLRLRSPLADDAYVVVAFSGTEHINDVYRYRLTLQSKRRRIHAQDIIGLAVTLELRRGTSPRFFHGVVDRWVDAGSDADGTATYHLDMVPHMALLTHASHNRIFENIAAIDIVTQLLSDCGERVDRSRLRSYSRREICTQFAETDLQFVNRLLAEEGIAYFFCHESDRYSCVLVDAPTDFGNADPPRCEYIATVAPESQQRDAIAQWQRQTAIASARLTSTDYDEYDPTEPLSVTTESRSPVARARNGEVQWFGQHYFQRNSAAARNLDAEAARSHAARWLAGSEGEASRISGSSTLAGLGAGLRIAVENVDDNRAVQVLMLAVQHQASDGNAQESFYANTFVAVDAAVGCIPHPHQRRPRISGTHSAKVVAVKDPASEGALAEVRVKFPWESVQASCWARVAQLYAGNRWGSYFVPEPGQEVLVEFLNADPDRPVIVGALYNRDRLLPPYTRTQSGIRTRSKNFNELRFDDRDGNEELFFQAGRDYNYHVNNDETGTIANNRRVTISNGNDETVICSGSQLVDVAGNITITAGQSITLQVGSSVIRIEPACITLQGTLIALDASAQIEISGGAVTDIEGGIVRINS